MIYKKSGSTHGAWLTKDVKADLINDSKCKIVTEVKPVEGEYGIQDVAKIEFEGQDEALNVALNKTSINGLIDAYGDDSVEWQGRDLTVKLESGIYGGKRGVALYLVADGYKVGEVDGFVKIVKSE